METTALENWIGKKESTTDLLTPALVERFAATFDMTCDTGLGAAAPSLIHLCLCPPVLPTSKLGPDGHAKRGGFLPPVPLPNRMWAGGAFRYFADLKIGDEITRHSTIKNITQKEGRAGPLCFVEVEHVVYSGESHALTETHNIVYKNASPPAGAHTTPAKAGEHIEKRHPSPPLLFRYSALTFNGHRIHYDEPYAREIEGYPGLVVHGPLQATWLFQLAEKLEKQRPSQFTYRNLSPLFHTQDVLINAEETDEGLDLWAAAKGGPVSMRAQALFA